MSALNPDKLQVKFMPGIQPVGTVAGRRYTLTHSDVTGDLFLSIGDRYDRKKLRGLMARLLRDEVLAEWRVKDEEPALHVHCHISGGLVFGLAGWRYEIFQHHMPQVLQAFRYGDRRLFEARPDLDDTQVWLHFHAWQKRYNQVEDWGPLATYRIGKLKRSPSVSGQKEERQTL